MSTFALDPILAKDSLPITDLKLCTLRLMNDKRYPWIIMIPMQNNLTEIIDLNEQNQQQLMQEISFVSEHLQTIFKPDKLNVAALGNQVRQLHVHVIARNQNDIAWPNPVWGVGETEPYSESHCKKQLEKLSLLCLD